MSEEAALQALVEQVRSGRAYRHLLPELVRRVAAIELAKRGSSKLALKATRAKLHQMVGAYEDLPKNADQLLASAAPEDLVATAVALAGRHASTRERREEWPLLWDLVGEDLPPGGTLLDLACGLQPLTLAPGMLPPTCTYLACDAHLGLLGLASTYLSRIGWAHEALGWDLLSGPPPRSADVVLLLKTLPCLEQADPAASRRLLSAVRAPVVLVTYPRRSLGGRQVGMETHYERRLANLLEGLSWHCEPLALSTELGFRLRSTAT